MADFTMDELAKAIAKAIKSAKDDDPDTRDNEAEAARSISAYELLDTQRKVNDELDKRLKLLDDEHDKLSGIGQLITGQAKIKQ